MKIGSRVVCINDNFHPETVKRIFYLPKKDMKYHIRDIFPSQRGIAVHLKEIKNKPIPNDLISDVMFEPSFSSHRFVEIKDYELIDSIYEEVLMFA